MRDKMECPACMKWTWADKLACEWCGGPLPPTTPPSLVFASYADIPSGTLETVSFGGGFETCISEHIDLDTYFIPPIITIMTKATSPQRPGDFILSMSRAAVRTVEKAILSFQRDKPRQPGAHSRWQ